jgi:molybdopterin converting factor subunit 1
MNVTVRLFARARDLAGRDSLTLETPSAITVAELRRRIGAACPPLSSLLSRCAVAVNDEFANDDMTVPADAEIALLPPVSGG